MHARPGDWRPGTEEGAPVSEAREELRRSARTDIQTYRPVLAKKLSATIMYDRNLAFLLLILP